MKSQNHFTPLRQHLYDTFAICRYVIPASAAVRFHAPEFFDMELETNRSAYFIQGISRAIKKNPEVNSSFIRNNWSNKSKIVRFENVNCAVSFDKKASETERYPFTYVFKNADQMSLKEIGDKAEYIKKTPVSDIPEFQRFLKFVNMPTLLRKLFLRKIISNEDMFQEIIGTFNLSNLSLLQGAVGGSMYSPRLVVDVATFKETKELGICYNFNHALFDGRELAKLNYEIIKTFKSCRFD